MAGENVVDGGKATVIITGKLVLDTAEAKEQIANVANDGGDVSTPDARPAGRNGRGRTGGGTGTSETVDAKVKTTVTGDIAKDIRAAIDKDMYQLTIDTGSIREQIKNALKAPFTITINAEIEGALKSADVGTRHGPAVEAGAPIGRGAPPPEVTQLLAKESGKLSKAIDTLYRNINEAFSAAGKGSFGSQNPSIGTGHQAEKALELMNQFGDKFSDMLQLDPMNRATGGAMSPKSLGALLGLDPGHESLGVITTNATGLGTQTGDKLVTRTADSLFSLLRKWDQSAPLTAAPAAAAEAATTAARETVRAETPIMPTRADKTPVLEKYAEAAKLLRAEQSKITTEPFDATDLLSKYPINRKRTARTAKPMDDATRDKLIEQWEAADQDIRNLDTGLGTARGLGSGDGRPISLSQSDRKDRMRLFDARDAIGRQLDFADDIVREKLAGGLPTPPRASDDPAADARAFNQLTGSTARGSGRATMIGGMPRRVIGGIDVTDKMESLLKAARGEGADEGEFNSVIRTEEGKLERFRPSSEEEAGRADLARKNKRGYTINGKRVTNVGPTEAFWDQVSQTFDADIAGELRADPEVANLAQRSLRQGGARRPLVTPHVPPPGQGGGDPGGISWGSGHGLDAGVRAAHELLTVLERIATLSAEVDAKWTHIAEMSASGKPTSRLEQGARASQRDLDLLEEKARGLAGRAADIDSPRLQALSASATRSDPVLKAAQMVQNARVREQTGGRDVNLSQYAVSHDVGLTPEESLKKFLSDPKTKGAAGRELGLGGAQKDMLERIMAKFDDPEYATSGENSKQALQRAAREVTGPFLASLKEKGTDPRVRSLGEEATGDVYRTLFGEKDRFERAPNAPQAVDSRTRTGGILDLANKDANDAIDRRESGAGRGWVARESGGTLTGLSTNQGRPEVEPGYVQTATSLDAERQAILGRVAKEKEERAIAVRTARQDAERAAGARFPGVRVGSNGGETSYLSPVRADGGGGQAEIDAYKKFVARSTASRLAKIPKAEDPSARLAEIKATQARADEMLTAAYGAAPDDVNKQREIVGRGGRRGRVQDDAARSEALELLQHRAAGPMVEGVQTARLPTGLRNTRDPASGDENREIFLDKKGIGTGTAGTKQAGWGYRPKEMWASDGISASQGTMHVIIAGQTAPVTVSLAGSAGGSDGGGRPPRGRTAAGGDEQGPPKDEAPKQGPLANRTLYSATEGFDKQYGGRDPLGTRKHRGMGVKRTAQDIAQERSEREQAAREKSAERYMAGASPSAAEKDFLAALQVASKASATPTPGAPGRRYGPSLKIVDGIEKQRRAERESRGPGMLEINRSEQSLARQRAKEEAAAAAAPPLVIDRREQAINQQRVRQAAADKAETDRQARKDRRAVRTNDPLGLAQNRDTSDDELEQMRGQNRRVQRFVPRRGFGASLVDLVTASVGGKGFEKQLESADRAQRELNEINSTAEKRNISKTQLQGTLKAARAERDPATGRVSERGIALFAQARETQQVIQGQNAAIKESSKRFKENAEAATKASTVLASFSSAAVGSIVSTTIGAFTVGLGMAVAAPIIQGVTTGMQAALGPIVERAGGFAGTTSRVTSGFADVYRQGGGAPGAIAGAAAQTGISAAAFADMQPLIEPRAQAEAGNKAIQEQLDLLHTSQNLLNDKAQFPGLDKNITKSTGGVLFGGDLFGIPSTAQQVTGELDAIPSVEKRAMLQDQLNNTAQLMANGNPDAKTMGELAEKADSFIAALAKGDTTLKFFSDQAEKGGSKLKLVSDSAESANSALLAEAAGLPELAASFRKSGTGVAGATSTTDIGEFLAAVNRGATTPDPGLLLQADSRSIQAQIQGEDLQRQFQIGTVNPQTFAMGEATNPLLPAATGIDTTGLNATDQKKINDELGQTQKLYDQINADVAVGITQAKDFVKTTFSYDPKVGEDFATSLDKVAALGKEISGIQIGVQTKQAAYAAAQYSQQIYLANRSLKDAKGLTGEITKQNGDNLGVIERQTFLLQRQGQALGLGLSQKQINFQRALANFQSPGLTSEEREARKEQAKTEADYAQKQLDIQKKLYGLGGQQFKIGASRGVKDLVRQIGLLERGREVALSTAAAEKKILALTKIQAKENKNVQTFYDAAIQRTGDIQGEIVKLAAATGKSIRDVGDIVLKEFKASYDGFIDILNGGTGQPSSKPTGPPRRRESAAGFLGSVSGATSLGKWGVAGEAAGEAVAILKDPQKLVSPMGGGGPSNSFTVNIINPIVRSDDDRRKLIVDVKRALQQEAKLLLPNRA